MIENHEFCRLSEADIATVIGGESEDIAYNLRRLRLELGYRRADLADELNISLSTIAKYETGSRIPDIDTIIQLSKVLHTNVNNLIFKELILYNMNILRKENNYLWKSCQNKN